MAIKIESEVIIVHIQFLNGSNVCVNGANPFWDARVCVCVCVYVQGGCYIWLLLFCITDVAFSKNVIDMIAHL